MIEYICDDCGCEQHCKRSCTECRDCPDCGCRQCKKQGDLEWKIY